MNLKLPGKKDSLTMLAMAFPAMVTQISATMVQIVDTIFIGQLGALALGAAAITGTIVFNITAVGDGFSTGVVAAIARMTGRGDREQASIFSTTGIAVLTVIGALFIAPLLAGSSAIFRLMRIPLELESTAWDYYSVFISFVPAIYGFTAVSASFRARGDTKTPMIVGLIINLINMVLDWLLIFGRWIFPAMGVRGAALASGISFTAGFALLLAISILSSRGLFRFRLSHLSLPHFVRMVRIAVPSMIERFAMSFSQLIVMAIAVNPLGSFAIASFHIIMRLASLSFMPGFGFAMATATLTGQHLGANDPAGAERMIWIGSFFCGLMMAAISIIYFTLAEPLILLFTSSEEILAETIMPLRIYASFAVFMAPAMVARGGLNGAGDTGFTLKMMIISRFIIRLPLAWFLGIVLEYGLSGVWLAMCLDFVLRGFSFLRYTRVGPWKERVV